MKVLKIAVQAIVLLGVLLAGIGWILPSKKTIERAIDINTPVAPIYQILITSQETNNWSPWAQIDPENTDYTFEGPIAGEGAIMKWSSSNSDVGAGVQIWQTCIHNKEIVCKIEFEGAPEPFYATFFFDEFDGYTEVTWQLVADYGSNPFMHYMTLFTETVIGPKYEKGLRNLKKYMESKHLHEEELDIEIKGDALVDSLSHLEN